MHSQPTVNWWRGNLRPHESSLSLIARFANLNGLKIAESEQYFADILRTPHGISVAAINELTNALSEDLTTIQTVIGETLSLGGQHEFSFPPEKSIDMLRYCEQCASDGYHSYIHEYRWLALCPFHAIPLKTSHVVRGAGSVQVRRCKTLAKLMQDSCPHWPRSGIKEFVPEEHDGFRWLFEWTQRVTRLATRFAQKIIWSSEALSFYRAEGYGHKLGQLHALEPIPDAHKRLFTELQEGWGAEIAYFPIEAKQELARIQLRVEIFTVFQFYKRIAAYSSQAYEFNQEVDKCRTHFSDHHKECRCEWRRQVDGFNTWWFNVPPDGHRYWVKICPYEIAVEQLELAVGRRLEVLSRRHREEERTTLLRDSQLFVDLGLVGLTPEAQVSPYGYALSNHGLWPCLEWIGTPWLNIVLDQIAKFEVLATFDYLRNWLDTIDAGEHPSSYADSCPRVRLSETEEGLALVRWRRRLTDE